MSQRKIPIAVVSCIQRRETGERLAKQLGAELFMDEGEAGTSVERLSRSRANHERAWSWAGKLKQRAIIVEDDVTPATDIRERAAEWFDRFPDDLINFYLGDGWSHIEAASIAALQAYDNGGPDHIRLDSLWGAQCYSIPTHQIQAVIDDHRTDLGADFALGASWRAHNDNREVIHVLESLVQHNDLPSEVWTDSERPHIRNARRLHVPTPPQRRGSQSTT